MDKQDALDKLPKFKHLEGTYSKSFGNKKIDLVMVNLLDQQSAAAYYHCTVESSVGWSNDECLDKGRWTIVARLEDGTFVSVKTIVKRDKLHNLEKEAKSIDHMY